MESSLCWVVDVPGAFEEVVERVTVALGEYGFGVLSRIDVHEVLRAKIGVERPPLTILGACNPRFAHRALEIDPDIGLLIPCNATVEQLSPDRCRVRVGKPEVMLSVGTLREHGELAPLGGEASTLLMRVVDNLAAGGGASGNP